MKSIDLANTRLVVDPAAAADLRAKLNQDPQGGLKQVAQQFEGMLLQLLLKSMRDATASSGLLDSQQSRFFTAIGDQQMALNLASQMPMGLAGLIEQQSGQAAKADAGSGALDALQQSLASLSPASEASYLLGARQRAGLLPGVKAGSSAATLAAGSPSAPRDFVERVWPHAQEAAAATGVPARFLVAHSALESGWGRHEIRNADGSPSFNVFGIKAGRNWSGATVEVDTTEFVNGVAQSERATFRAYASYAEAFRDYARLLASKPRYAGVVGQQDGVQFARSLQQAGYATDPMYADKLARIIGGSTLRQALAG
ncbi:MAG: flagellar assembly peptidoglycan hydrolase FlgJ [Candidatus Accumulibacter sp.]|jgi:flagellar protein FlgJ|uniref:flagellar assembly peptidoglycan hydrolase FlgJ n=1 Tax=Accumulibacter sp. TaxID=2053492 RepID=UPI0012C592DB|nr:flagellar assembly peptidoglycan hydrolase FlgJ [Accumulibacter sp.]MQM34998.1 flagellar assembly peptidoglycan hydrolase FlgJ [Candidatus Accumulibacter phosphatis]MBL8368864.1 flagellar assembly peptidoglycan hydrolase FlgJ [Accumulibacter sp.]MBN8512891.1 flagellar assembly peptidoglycan hydrolase FlgJ [Accumulibacter sp.]MBO3702150.1 flagellar assembly peptidoglycan hydrolase FlgJ [Accumulibacter sp.]HRI92095.1 flagellar assembly peptidoglycan hydrolase FlgJ [Accumulibacter sp.]